MGTVEPIEMPNKKFGLLAVAVQYNPVRICRLGMAKGKVAGSALCR